MENMTLCKGGCCPMRGNCARYTKKVVSGEFYFPLIPEIAGMCDEYIENIPHEEYFSEKKEKKDGKHSEHSKTS